VLSMPLKVFLKKRREQLGFEEMSMLEDSTRRALEKQPGSGWGSQFIIARIEKEGQGGLKGTSLSQRDVFFLAAAYRLKLEPFREQLVTGQVHPDLICEDPPFTDEPHWAKLYKSAWLPEELLLEIGQEHSQKLSQWIRRLQKTTKFPLDKPLAQAAVDAYLRHHHLPVQGSLFSSAVS
jgi:hypothetical protein